MKRLKRLREHRSYDADDLLRPARIEDREREEARRELLRAPTREPRWRQRGKDAGYGTARPI